MDITYDLSTIRDEFFCATKGRYDAMPRPVTKGQFCKMLFEEAAKMGERYDDTRIQTFCMELAVYAANMAYGGICFSADER